MLLRITGAAHCAAVRANIPARLVTLTGAVTAATALATGGRSFAGIARQRQAYDPDGRYDCLGGVDHKAPPVHGLLFV